MQQLDLPDPKPVVQAHSGIRSITRGNFALIFWLILVDGEIKLPKASLEQLQEQHTVRANTKEQANFMAKLEQAAKSVSELKEAANKLGRALCDPNKVDLTSFVKHGCVDAAALYLIKRIQRQGYFFALPITSCFWEVVGVMSIGAIYITTNGLACNQRYQ